MTRTSIACVIVWLVPLVAAAQSGGGTAMPLSQGPMTVERLHSGFLIAPDIKVTEMDNKTSTLAGLYGGWVAEDTFFVGVGGYWLTGSSQDRDMEYGGLIVQWLAQANDRVGFSVKGLFGGGEARLTSTLNVNPEPQDLPFDRVHVEQVVPGPGGITTVRFREDFVVAEPELDLRVRLAPHLRLTAGIGYRFIAAQGPDDNRLRGAVGSVALQIGGGS